MTKLTVQDVLNFTDGPDALNPMTWLHFKAVATDPSQPAKLSLPRSLYTTKKTGGNIHVEYGPLHPLHNKTGPNAALFTLYGKVTAHGSCMDLLGPRPPKPGVSAALDYTGTIG